VRQFLFLGTSAVALTASLVAAQAGGFATRDQSAVGEGMAFAGEGTPGMGLSAMFWNPAAVTQVSGGNGWGVEAHVSATFPRADLTTNPALVTPALQFLDFCSPAMTSTCDNQGNVLKDRVFPAFYGAYRVTPDWYVGLAVNEPFGFKSTLNPAGFTAIGPGAGPSASYQQLATSASISTVDVNPTVGWKINNTVSVGAGVQFLWLKNEFSRDLFQFPAIANFNSPINLSARDFGVGFTAGATWTPTPATEIALGYRSRVKLTLNGSEFFVPNAVLLASPATAPLNGATVGVTGPLTLPDQLNLGARYRVNDSWTVLGTLEWTHWSITRNIPYFATSGPLAGQNAGMDINFNYRDGWFVALGTEYNVRPDITLRAGINHDTSPVQGTLGWIALPGADSTSASLGASYKVTRDLTFDLAYSYTWMRDQTIVVGPGNPDQTKLITLIPGVFNTWGGNYASHSQAVSLSLRYAFAPPAPPAPPNLITKAK
jgi:long-chain fatty acid transport protein